MNSDLAHTAYGTTSIIFKAIAGGVEMTDIVHYKLPFWFLGDMAHRLFLKQRLKDIFDYRYKIIAQKFGSWEATASQL
jgi:hypothetical protein